MTEPTPRRKAPARRRVPPPPKRNGRALKTGAGATGEFLPEFAEVKAEVQAAIDAAGWLKETDLLVFDLFVRELTVYRRASAALVKLGDTGLNKKLSAQKLQIRRGRLLLQMANTMGFTAESRFRLGLTQAVTERAKQGAAPVRTPERARQVAELLARSGALPPIDAEAEVVDEEEK